MSEVKRYEWAPDGTGYGCFNGEEPEAGFLYTAQDFDRVTAERDALQQRLNAADERVDALDAEWSRTITERGMLQLRVDLLEGLLLQTNELLYAIQGDPGSVPSSAIDAMRGEVFTALKPTEGDGSSKDFRMIGTVKMPPMEYDEP